MAAATSIFPMVSKHAKSRVTTFRLPFLLAALLLLNGCSEAGANGESWYFYAGLLVLIAFIPLTVFSYRGIRLPQKQEEYERIMERLAAADIEDSQTFSIIDEKYTAWDYILPVVFVSLFSFIAFSILFRDNAEILLAGAQYYMGAGVLDLTKGSLLAILMAFLGAYVWSVQYIFRRLVTIDLPPGAYYSVGIRMVLSSFVSLIFFHFIIVLPAGEMIAGNYILDISPDSTLKHLLPVIAFFTGLFPQRALRAMADRLKFIAKRHPNAPPPMPLDLLEGISPYHKERFAELSIDNVQNLVKASLVELILKTPFKPRQLIDWILQGRLHLYFKDNVVKLRRAEIRTILGFRMIGDEGKLDALAETTGLEKAYLETVYDTIKGSVAITRLNKAKDCLHSI